MSKNDEKVVCSFCGKKLTEKEKDNYTYINICDECDRDYKEM